MQHKTAETLSTELELPVAQLLGLFNRAIRRSVQYLLSVMEHTIEQGFVRPKKVKPDMAPVSKSMQDELEEVAKVMVYFDHDQEYFGVSSCYLIVFV